MEQSDEIKVVNLECILMPNGEIMCLGKSIGWFDELGKYLSEVKD